MALSGAVHFVRIAQQECKRQLSKAVCAFQHCSVASNESGTQQVHNEGYDDDAVGSDSEDEAAYVPPTP